MTTVHKVVDGDTIRITLGDGTKTTVRLLGIDAPDPNADDDAANGYGDEAMEHVEKQFKVGREIWLETDETDEDDDGRLLRYVQVEMNDGDVYLLNEVPLRDGFAVHAPSEDDDERAERLVEAHLTALAARFRGLTEAVGVPRIRVHDLRHTSATLLLANGELSKVVAERLGHHDGGVTLNR